MQMTIRLNECLATLTILSILLLFSGCSRDNVADNALLPISIPTATPDRYGLAQRSSDLALIMRFAESYEPKSGREVIPSPPVVDEKIQKIFTDLASVNSREHEKYILLIFLRLSRFQIEHFKQRYELGRENPLTREFYRLIGEVNYDKAELMSSDLADRYVETHPELLQYTLIDSEMKRIARASDK